MEKEEQAINVPVLIIGFNRPDISAQTFEYIRKAKPQKLYVAIDGARPDKVGEEKLVEQVKEIVEDVDWPCETHYKYNKTNKGAEINVSSAISWVFETEEYAIILEDDIIAPMSFLKFAQEMLIKYKDDERIGLVSGCNFTPLQNIKYDYIFVKYGHSWGWATWKRVWRKYDLNINVKEDHLKRNFLLKISNNKNEMKYYRKYFLELKKRGPGNSTWDRVFGYILRIYNYLTIVPKVNLTSNIGVYGLHAKGQSEHHFRSFDDTFVVKKQPKSVKYNQEYDIHHFSVYINSKSSIRKRILRKIKTLLYKLYKSKLCHIKQR